MGGTGTFFENFYPLTEELNQSPDALSDLPCSHVAGLDYYTNKFLQNEPAWAHELTSDSQGTLSYPRRLFNLDFSSRMKLYRSLACSILFLMSVLWEDGDILELISAAVIYRQITKNDNLAVDGFYDFGRCQIEAGGIQCGRQIPRATMIRNDDACHSHARASRPFGTVFGLLSYIQGRRKLCTLSREITSAVLTENKNKAKKYKIFPYISPDTLRKYGCTPIKTPDVEPGKCNMKKQEIETRVGDRYVCSFCVTRVNCQLPDMDLGKYFHQPLLRFILDYRLVNEMVEEILASSDNDYVGLDCFLTPTWTGDGYTFYQLAAALLVRERKAAREANMPSQFSALPYECLIQLFEDREMMQNLHQSTERLHMVYTRLRRHNISLSTSVCAEMILHTLPGETPLPLPKKKKSTAANKRKAKRNGTPTPFLFWTPETYNAGMTLAQMAHAPPVFVIPTPQVMLYQPSVEMDVDDDSMSSSVGSPSRTLVEYRPAPGSVASSDDTDNSMDDSVSVNSSERSFIGSPRSVASSLSPLEERSSTSPFKSGTDPYLMISSQIVNDYHSQTNTKRSMSLGDLIYVNDLLDTDEVYGLAPQPNSEGSTGGDGRSVRALDDRETSPFDFVDAKSPPVTFGPMPVAELTVFV